MQACFVVMHACNTTFEANITEVAEKMLDHAVVTPNGMTKIVSTLKARVMTAIEQEDDRFAVLKVDIKSAFITTKHACITKQT